MRLRDVGPHICAPPNCSGSIELRRHRSAQGRPSSTTEGGGHRYYPALRLHPSRAGWGVRRRDEATRASIAAALVGLHRCTRIHLVGWSRKGRRGGRGREAERENFGQGK